MATRKNGKRRRFSDYHQDAVRRILGMGITTAQMAALQEFGLLACDNVTGFHEGRSGKGRFATLQRLIHHVRETNEEAVYVELDVRNLGGLNAALGHTRANDVFAAIAAAVRSAFTAAASEAVFFRHGGDEVSAFLVDTSGHALGKAIKRVRQGVAQVATAFGVEEIPHPKHRQRCGVGVHVGVCRITAAHEADPTAVFREADTAVELCKRHWQGTASPLRTGGCEGSAG